MPANEEMKVDLDAITNMARRLGFKGKDATDYIHEHMTRLGYKSRRSYYKDDKSSGGERSAFSFFGNSNRSDDDDE